MIDTPKGLQGYEREIGEIREWLSGDWISEREFDAKVTALFREVTQAPDGSTVIKPKRRPLSPHGLKGDSYILGGGGLFDDGMHLDVLQVLQRETDWIDTVTRDDGLVWYRLRRQDAA
jgi:hypothetical protein